MRLLPGFVSSAPSLPAPPPPTQTIDDPAIAVAKNKQALADATRRGRAASILTGPGGALGDTTVDRPTATGNAAARSAVLLGG